MLYPSQNWLGESNTQPTALADEETASEALSNLPKVTELQLELGSRSPDFWLQLHLMEQSCSTAFAELLSTVAVHQSQTLEQAAVTAISG